MIHKLYYFHLRFWVRLAIRLFYRKVEIRGEENLPKEGPVLLAPNHQNAFMDALLPATLCPRTIHFLVRADVFKSPAARRFFHSIQMMPVYRQRDGIQNLAKNEETFEKCYEILRNGKVLLLFPEATHEGVRKLRPLSKGFTRILFGALEGNENLDIKVVPLGLNYSNYSDSQSKVLMSYGKPISVQEYHDQILENKAKAMTSLKKEVYEELSKEIIHIEGKRALKAFDIELERILPFYPQSINGKKVSESPFYKSREQALESLDEESTYFRRLFIYDGEMKRRNLRAPFFFIFRPGSLYRVLQSILLLLLLPVFLLAWLVHAPAYFTIKLFLDSKIRDRQFHSSLKLVGMIVLFPLVALIASLFVLSLSPTPLKVSLALILFFPLSILIVRELRLPYRYSLTFWRMTFIRWRNKSLYKYLERIEKEILENIDSHENRFRNKQPE